jgi:D-alanyl-D-alanine carboxypeptidase
MTLRARALGMTRTTFRNASGLPDPDNVTTARDMATLGLRLIRDFPDRYRYFSTVHFAWGRQTIRNHNRMLGDYDGADGIKTGFIRDSGFNIVTSAQRDGVRLVGVTMGGSSWVERDRHMGALLDQGFAQVGVAPAAAVEPDGRRCRRGGRGACGHGHPCAGPPARRGTRHDGTGRPWPRHRCGSGPRGEPSLRLALPSRRPGGRRSGRRSSAPRRRNVVRIAARQPVNHAVGQRRAWQPCPRPSAAGPPPAADAPAARRRGTCP